MCGSIVYGDTASAEAEDERVHQRVKKRKPEVRKNGSVTAKTTSKMIKEKSE